MSEEMEMNDKEFESEVEEENEVEVEEKKEAEGVEPEFGYCKDHGKVIGIPQVTKHGIKLLRCPECNKLLRKLGKGEEIEEEVEKEIRKIEGIETEEENGDEEEFTTPEEEFVAKALEYLRKELSRFGLCRGKLLDTIISTLEVNPYILKNPQLLHIHIKNIARNANDYLLSLIIQSLFNKYGYLLTQPQIPIVYGQYQSTQGSPVLQYSAPNTPSTPPLPYPSPSPHPYMGPYTGPYPTTTMPTVDSQPKKKYVIAIDGQNIEVSDYKEYLALKEWENKRKMEEEERRRREEEHQLRMKKLEEEIKSIALSRSKEEDSKKETTQQSDIMNILNSRISSLESLIRKLTEEKESLQKKLDEMEQKRREEELNVLKAELARLREIAGNPFKLVLDYENQLRQLGYMRSGRSLLDIIAETQKSIDESMKILLSKIPLTPQPSVSQVSPVKYSEKERKEKLAELKSQIQMTEEALKAEEEYLKTLQKVYSKK